MLSLHVLKKLCGPFRRGNILKVLALNQLSSTKPNDLIRFSCAEPKLSILFFVTICHRPRYVVAMTGFHCHSMHSKRFVFNTAVQKTWCSYKITMSFFIDCITFSLAMLRRGWLHFVWLDICAKLIKELFSTSSCLLPILGKVM